MPLHSPRLLRFGLGLVCAPLIFAHEVDQSQLIAEMAEKANTLLDSLNEEKREAASLSLPVMNGKIFTTSHSIAKVPFTRI